MPRRPWRSLNAFSASPMRVPLDQSGAAAAARWIARSGWRPASARVSRVSRVANTNASTCGPLPAAEVEELQVGARVGLHRARDVAQHHEPARHDAAPPAREAERLAAGAQAARAGVRRRSMSRPWRAALVAARAPQRRGELEPRHQPVELRELVRRRARRSACSPAAPRRWPARAGPRPRRRRPRASPRAGGGGDVAPTPSASVVASGAVARRAAPAGRTSASGSSAAPVAEHLGEHAVERRDLRLVGDEHRARGPVQAPPRHRPHQRQRAREVGRRGRASSARRPRAGAGSAPAASGGRSSSIVSTPKLGHRCRTSWSRPAARITSWSSSYLSTEPSVRFDGRGVERARSRAAQRRQPVDRLGDARRLLHVGVAHARDRVGDLDRERLRARPSRAGGRSRPRAAAIG